MSFSGTPKIMTFEYYAMNKTYSEVNFIFVYQNWSKLIEKWPPKKKFSLCKQSNENLNRTRMKDTHDSNDLIINDLIWHLKFCTSAITPFMIIKIYVNVHNIA